MQPIGLSIRASLFLGILAIGLWLEHRCPLRKQSQSKLVRVIRNLAIAGVGTLALRLAFFPVVLAISEYVSNNKWGFLQQVKLSKPIAVGMAILALDYTLYIWHRMNHQIPFLWRFHNVHHVDLDLDISTASRFHFGELILSTGFRSAQVLLFGIDPFTLILFETLVVTFAQFHHSNVLLPYRFERYLNVLIVTPRMHGIHHSIIEKETNSNWSTIFSFWDRLHRSSCLNVPQQDITIGVAPYRDPKDLTLLKSLILPFKVQRPWKLPDGTYPVRMNTQIDTYAKNKERLVP